MILQVRDAGDLYRTKAVDVTGSGYLIVDLDVRCEERNESGKMVSYWKNRLPLMNGQKTAGGASL